MASATEVPAALAAWADAYRGLLGRKNRWQAQILTEFVPRFAPGGRVLHLGAREPERRHVDRRGLERLGLPASKHGRLPDVVVHHEGRDRLFLVEAVTSGGPIGGKRHAELEAVLGACSAGRVYVSAFPSFRHFAKHAAAIAWETVVWIAACPGHLVHYNGRCVLGPPPAAGRTSEPR
ncbi:MAG: hypothetical protein HY825_19065 [Acidobacteria bacterium]|nr:hypothetical protein [Acidobacteriota bacterium]